MALDEEGGTLREGQLPQGGVENQLSTDIPKSKMFEMSSEGMQAPSVSVPGFRAVSCDIIKMHNPEAILFHQPHVLTHCIELRQEHSGKERAENWESAGVSRGLHPCSMGTMYLSCCSWDRLGALNQSAKIILPCG